MIFSIIALGVVRPALLGKTFDLNVKEIQRGEFFRVFIDGMKTASDDGDLLKEGMLFDRMIDILRNPTLVKKLTKEEKKLIN